MTPIGKQPEPEEIGDVLITNDGKIMYSAMDIGQLMKLRSFINKLIRWKVQGNPSHIMTLQYEVTEITQEEKTK